MNKRITIGLFLALFVACYSMSAQTLKDAIRLTENEQYDLAADAFRKLIAAQPAGGGRAEY